MAHILTESEALRALHMESASECPNLEMLLMGVDDGLKIETGHDWTGDDPIEPTAKIAAMLLLISLQDGTPASPFYNQKVIQLDGKVKAGEVG